MQKSLELVRNDLTDLKRNDRSISRHFILHSGDLLKLGTVYYSILQQEPTPERAQNELTFTN